MSSVEVLTPQPKDQQSNKVPMSPAGNADADAATKEEVGPAPHILSDLAAQEKMAEASLWMALAAIGTMLVTFIGTIFLAKQVKLTRQAVNDTSEANQAMVDANAIARSQQRARISPFCRLEEVAYNDEQLLVGCENVGPTASFNLRCALQVVSEIPDQPPHFSEWGKGRMVKPGGEAHLIFAQGAVLKSALIGCIEYDTIFEKGCKTWVCMTFEQSKMSEDWYAVDSRPSSWPEDT